MDRQSPSNTNTTAHQTSAAENLIGICAMLAAMASLIVNDALVKLVADELPTGQIVAIRGLFASGFVMGLLWLRGISMSRSGAIAPATRRPVALRVGAETLAAFFFLSALFHMPIAEITAIMQLSPLVVMAAAAAFLGQPMGWRRWSAAAVGLLGVMLIVRPGSAAFTWWAFMGLIAVGLVAVRDLATQRIARSVPTLAVTAMTAMGVCLMGFALWPFEVWAFPSTRAVWTLAIAALFMNAAYALMIVAMRNGDVGVVVPFRYSIVVWGVLAGLIVWGEIPDRWTLLGVAIIVIAGLYSMIRERTIRQTSRQ